MSDLYIFDLDYTLMDTARFKEDLAEIFNLSVTQFSCDYDELFKQPGKNFNLDDYLEILKTRHGFTDEQIKNLNRKFSHFIKEIDQYLFPETKEILKQAREKRGKLILISFGDQGWQKLKVDNLSIRSDFDQIEYESDDKSKNNFFNSLKNNGETIVLINDNAKESLEIEKALTNMGIRCEIRLIEGPYNYNAEHNYRIYRRAELLEEEPKCEVKPRKIKDKRQRPSELQLHR